MLTLHEWCFDLIASLLFLFKSPRVEEWCQINEVLTLRVKQHKNSQDSQKTVAIPHLEESIHLWSHHVWLQSYMSMCYQCRWHTATFSNTWDWRITFEKTNKHASFILHTLVHTFCIAQGNTKTMNLWSYDIIQYQCLLLLFPLPLLAFHHVCTETNMILPLISLVYH